MSPTLVQRMFGRMHLSKHVVDLWTREVTRPRHALLAVLILSVYLPIDEKGTVDQQLGHSVPVEHPTRINWGFISTFIVCAAPTLGQLMGLWLLRLLVIATDHCLEMMPLAQRTYSSGLRTRVWFIAIGLSAMAGATALPITARLTTSFVQPVSKWFVPQSLPMTYDRSSISALPLHLLVALDAAAAMTSAWSILMRIEPMFSTRITIPSPSHAPSLARSSFIIWLRTFFMGPVHASAVRAQQGRQRRLDRHRRQARVMAQQEAAAARRQPERIDTVPAGPPDMPVPASKPPREAGHTIEVDLPWLVDVALALTNRSLVAAQYGLILASMPRIMAGVLLVGIALHQQVTALFETWSDARSSAECLEFVLRRWPGPKLTGSETQEEQVCAMCFEPVVAHLEEPGPEGANEEYLCLAHSAGKGVSRLDCGHWLHPTCVVSWLANQSFCPVCHKPLSLAPPKRSRAERVRPTEAGFPPAGVDPALSA